MSDHQRHGDTRTAKHSSKRKRIVRAGAPVPTSQLEQPRSVVADAAHTREETKEEPTRTATTLSLHTVEKPTANEATAVTERAQRTLADYRGLFVGIGLALIALVFFVIASGNIGGGQPQQPGEQGGTTAQDDTIFAGIDRNDISALMARGKELYDQNRFEDAARVYQEVVRLKPDSQAGHSNLGSAYFRLQRLPEALSSFREAVRINPNDAEARQNLAAGLAAMDDREGAIAEYLRAIELKPDLPQPHYSLGVLYQLAGQNEKAIQELKRYLELGTDERLRADAQQRLQTLGAK